MPSSASRTDLVGRLAPTPSGELHLGNALAFMACWLSVRSQDGTLLLRFEDVDRSRARRHLEDHQRRDLEWLGLTWDAEVPPQRDRDYQPWLDRLDTYFCTCSRRTIREGGGNHPLSCRSAGHTEGAIRFKLPAGPVTFNDRLHGEQTVTPLDFGDPVLRRRDGVFTYSLAVVADDIEDRVTEVVRGADLLEYTAVQTQLWAAFGAPSPTWLHAPMLLEPDGRKLSKSHGSTGLAELREAGVTAQQIRQRLLRWLNQPEDTYDNPRNFAPDQIRTQPITLPEHDGKQETEKP